LRKTFVPQWIPPLFQGQGGTEPTIQHEDINRTREAVAVLKGIIAAS
jgi:hypothetical protein